MKPLSLLVLLCLSSLLLCAQKDSSLKIPPAFERIISQVATFKPDTSTPPQDRTTARIKELIALGGVFNMQEALSFKMGEERQKGEVPAAQLQQLETFFLRGNGKRWLDNSIVWIYRKHFTEKEIKQMLKFYRSGAGRKMSERFPVIMLQSLSAAQGLKEQFEKAQKGQ